MIRASQIHYSRDRRCLTVRFTHGESGELTAEFLRVHSPSAEVRGHAGQATQLVFGKREVQVIAIRPTGHYAIQLVFDDGHDSGIYTWRYLSDLIANQASLWSLYLDRLSREQRSRDPNTHVINLLS